MLKTCYYSNSLWQVWRNHWPQNLIKSINIANNKLFHRIHTGNLAARTSLPDSTQLTFNCCQFANHALDLLNAQLSSAAWSTDSMATSELKWQNMGETNCLSQSSKMGSPESVSNCHPLLQLTLKMFPEKWKDINMLFHGKRSASWTIPLAAQTHFEFGGPVNGGEGTGGHLHHLRGVLQLGGQFCWVDSWHHHLGAVGHQPLPTLNKAGKKTEFCRNKNIQHNGVVWGVQGWVYG